MSSLSSLSSPTQAIIISPVTETPVLAKVLTDHDKMNALREEWIVQRQEFLLEQDAFLTQSQITFDSLKKRVGQKPSEKIAKVMKRVNANLRSFANELKSPANAVENLATEFNTYLYPQQKLFLRYLDWDAQIQKLEEVIVEHCSNLELFEGPLNHEMQAAKVKFEQEKTKAQVSRQQLYSIVQKVDQRIVACVRAQKLLVHDFSEYKEYALDEQKEIKKDLNFLLKCYPEVSSKPSDVAANKIQRAVEDHFTLTEMRMVKIHQDQTLLDNVLKRTEEYLKNLKQSQLKFPRFQKLIEEGLAGNTRLKNWEILEKSYERMKMVVNTFQQRLQETHQKFQPMSLTYIFTFQKFVAEELHLENLLQKRNKILAAINKKTQNNEEIDKKIIQEKLQLITEINSLLVMINHRKGELSAFCQLLHEGIKSLVDMKKTLEIIDERVEQFEQLLLQTRSTKE